jgi:integrase
MGYAPISSLLRSQVDLVRRTAWIHPDQAKARKAILVPLSSVTVLVLRKQIGKHQANVFTFKRQDGASGEHQGMAQGIKAGWHREFPLA